MNSGEDMISRAAVVSPGDSAPYKATNPPHKYALSA